MFDTKNQGERSAMKQAIQLFMGLFDEDSGGTPGLASC